MIYSLPFCVCVFMLKNKSQYFILMNNSYTVKKRQKEKNLLVSIRNNLISF